MTKSITRDRVGGELAVLGDGLTSDWVDNRGAEVFNVDGTIHLLSLLLSFLNELLGGKWDGELLIAARDEV
jgi:hypothetical protein